jgi:hypothetical protein
MKTATTTTELARIIGCRGTFNHYGMLIDIKVIDTRKVFARVDALITPIAGQGAKWVRADGIRHLKTADGIRLKTAAEDATPPADEDPAGLNTYNCPNCTDTLSGTIDEAGHCTACGYRVE